MRILTGFTEPNPNARMLFLRGVGRGTGSWGKNRVGMSKLATWIAKKNLTSPCSDPMSGFFALHRYIIDHAAERIQSRGFKILFDILTFPDLQLQVREVPYVFKERTLGACR